MGVIVAHGLRRGAKVSRKVYHTASLVMGDVSMGSLLADVSLVQNQVLIIL